MRAAVLGDAATLAVFLMVSGVELFAPRRVCLVELVSPV